jgi:hypothetical protein
MNSYGHPQHPEVAMLEELHILWGRVFGGEAAPGPGRARVWLLAGVMVVLVGIATSML